MIIATESEEYGGYEGIVGIWDWLKRKLRGSEDLWLRCGILKKGDKDVDRGGTKDNCVKILQSYLWKLGYYHRVWRDTTYSKDVDGIFGPRTEAAVKAFQRDKGLPETGKVDKATWEVLIGSIGTSPEVIYVPVPQPVYVPQPTPAPAPKPTPTPPPSPPAKASVFEKYLPWMLAGLGGILLVVALTKREVGSYTKRLEARV